MNIYLVGFMATGKTSVGKELALKLKFNFIDLDDLIELKERRRIPEIFAKSGEPYFRKVESLTLKEVATQKNFVIACGGGVVINPDNIELMKQSGKLICLTAQPEVILKRSQNAANRPLLNVPNPKKQIDLLLKMRAPYYCQSHCMIETSKLSISQVVQKILKVTKSVRSESKPPRRG